MESFDAQAILNKLRGQGQHAAPNNGGSSQASYSVSSGYGLSGSGSGSVSNAYNNPSMSNGYNNTSNNLNLSGGSSANFGGSGNQNSNYYANQVSKPSPVYADARQIPVTYMTPNQRKELNEMRTDLEIENEKLQNQLKQCQAENRKLAEEKKIAEEALQKYKVKSEENVIRLRNKIAQLKEVIADVQYAQEKRALALTSLGVVGSQAPKLAPNLASSETPRPRSSNKSGSSSPYLSMEELQSGVGEHSHFKTPTVSELMRRSSDKDSKEFSNTLRRPKGPNPNSNNLTSSGINNSGSSYGSASHSGPAANSLTSSGSHVFTATAAAATSLSTSGAQLRGRVGSKEVDAVAHLTGNGDGASDDEDEDIPVYNIEL